MPPRTLSSSAVTIFLGKRWNRRSGPRSEAHAGDPSMDARVSKAQPRRRLSGPRDPERTRAVILNAAIAEFTSKGLSGARIDRIAKRAGVNKRMIYYYFGNKEGLYVAV